MSEGYGMLGQLALLQGDLAQAQRFAHEAVTIATTATLFRLQSVWQPLLGIVTLYRGDSLAARRLLDESLQLALQLDERNSLAQIYSYLAEVDLWEGAIDQAAQWLTQSLSVGAKPEWAAFDDVQRCWIAARLATSQQQYHRAATLFGLAEQAHSQINHVIGGPMRTLADDALATVQAALQPAAFAEAFAAGQKMTVAEHAAIMLI